MRVGQGPRMDLFSFYAELSGPAAGPGAPLDELLAQLRPELFSGFNLTGAEAMRGAFAPSGGVPVLASEVGHRVGEDPRVRDAVAARAAETEALAALVDGPFDREKVEKAVKDLFTRLAELGLPLEARPGSELAEAIATGDFSSFSDSQMLELLVLMALYGQNRHKPGSVARQPAAPMAPRGTWNGPGGANRAGGGTQATGLNRPAAAPTGPAPPAGEIPPGTPAGQRLARSAIQVANRMNSTGWCFRGVADAVVQATGVQLSGRSAYMAADQLARSDRFREVQVSPAQLRELPPGAVVVWGRTDRSPHGHISVALGDGREASDHIAQQITSLRGASNYRVFIPNE